MNDMLRGITSGVVGAITIVGAYVPFQMTLAVAGIAGAVVFAGTYLILPKKKDKSELLADLSVEHHTDEDDIFDYIKTMRSEVMVSNLTLRKLGFTKEADRVKDILVLLDAITEHAKKNQSSHATVKSFAKYHLTKFNQLLAEYASLADGHQTNRIRDGLRKLEQVLDTIHSGYEDFYEKLKKKQMSNLDIDGEAYQAVIRFEKS